MYHLYFYVPSEQLEEVKEALFQAGAGRIGNYDHCCWQVQGQGQFRPLEGSNPSIGSQNEVETLEEYRVEMVCSEEVLQPALKALLESHPYEEVAHGYYEINKGR